MLLLCVVASVAGVNTDKIPSHFWKGASLQEAAEIQEVSLLVCDENELELGNIWRAAVYFVFSTSLTLRLLKEVIQVINPSWLKFP